MSSNRLVILRQYLLDVRDYSGGLIETSDARNYVQWNFWRALIESFNKADKDRGVIAQIITKMDMKEKRLTNADLTPINSPMVEIRQHHIDRITKTQKEFDFWFYKKFVAPILSEESRILEYSSTKRVFRYGPPQAYFDRIAEIIRFKTWEVAHFPDAKDVPPRVEPTPEETNTRSLNE